MTRVPAQHNQPGAGFARRHMLAVLFEAQKGQCGICRKRMDPTGTAWDQRNPMRPTADHVLPRDAGGFNGRGNLLAAHARCNGAKGNRLPTDAELDFLAQVNALMGWPDPNPPADADPFARRLEQMMEPRP